MRQFDEEHKCKKCGAPHAKVEYIPVKNIGSLRLEECLQRTCVRCGYAWAEHPIDTKPPVS